MKTLFIVATLCIITSALSPVASAQAATAATKRTSNDIALEALNHVKSIFAEAATATNTEKAAEAAKAINATAEKISSLQTILKATPMPTVAEKKAFAQKMLQYESQVAIMLKKMTNTFDKNSEEVNKIIQPAFTSFQAKTTPMMTLIDIYYPRKEMKGYMDTLKGK